MMKSISLNRYTLLILFSIVVLSATAQEIETDFLLGKKKLDLKGEDYRLLREVDSAFQVMKKAALKEDIHIQVVSGYRSYVRQKSIWTRKYNRFTQQGLKPETAIAKIIEYSTIPGTSRHHWGTDLDIIDANKERPKSGLLLAKNYEEGGAYVALKKWMDVHANEYGFYLVYTDKIDRKGFKYEPWHYTYKPIAENCLRQFLLIDIVQQLNQDQLIGSEYFTKEFFEMYIKNNILDINPVLKD